VIPLSLYIFLLIELVVLTQIDFKVRKILNPYILLNILLFFFFIFSLKPFYSLKLDHFGYPLLFIVIGWPLFKLKIMGGGDSKLLSSLFLMIPTSFQDYFLLNLLWVTILVTGFRFLINILGSFDKLKEGIKKKDFSEFQKNFGKKIPFTPIILIAWIWIGVEKSEMLLPF
jgi:prepilin peptidase CpaA